METNQGLSNDGSPLLNAQASLQSLNRDDHEIRMSKALTNEENIELNELPPSRTRVILNNVMIVLGITVAFSLPLLLFTFLKPVRIIFKVVGNEVSEVGGPIGNYFVLIFIGIAIMILGMSTMLFEMIMAYSFQSFWKPYFIAMTYKCIGLAITHILSKTLLHDRVVKFFDSSNHFHALRYLARRRPYSTLFMIRFARLPSLLANYGTPVFGYSLVRNVAVAMLSSAFYISIYIFLGLSARSIEELEQMNVSGADKWVKYIPLMLSLVGVVIIICLFFYAKRHIENILRKYKIEELKARLLRRDISYESLE